jgi:hypothetical protein
MNAPGWPTVDNPTPEAVAEALAYSQLDDNRVASGEAKRTSEADRARPPR